MPRRHREPARSQVIHTLVAAGSRRALVDRDPWERLGPGR
jgi:hypothetical protein